MTEKHRRLPWAGWDLLQPLIPGRQPDAQHPRLVQVLEPRDSQIKRQDRTREILTTGNIQKSTDGDTVVLGDMSLIEACGPESEGRSFLRGGSWQQLCRIPQASEYELRAVLVESIAPSR